MPAFGGKADIIRAAPPPSISRSCPGFSRASNLYLWTATASPGERPPFEPRKDQMFEKEHAHHKHDDPGQHLSHVELLKPEIKHVTDTKFESESFG
jgi:hypothetical protein